MDIRDFAMMCSIALREFYQNHMNDNADLAIYASFLSDEMDNVIDKLTEEE